MPDDHSELEPPLPIPNRTVKQLHADDSADTRVKVGNRQAPPKNPLLTRVARGFCFSAAIMPSSGAAARLDDMVVSIAITPSAGAPAWLDAMVVSTSVMPSAGVVARFNAQVVLRHPDP